ncbi:MAG: pilus assembly protein TadG-related protein [Chloroflexota bacterium]|nr:pilus assembly protein TadG-related protein [Chloroflexota bacterium]
MPRPMLAGSSPATRCSRREREHGQMLVIFALALIALVGMVGLIIDGGDSFLQRRDQQNAADAAAMAAGYASANSQDATAAAKTVAAANGYTNGVNGTTVTVTITGGSIKVDVSKPHQNYFAGVMGFTSWGVSTTASVQAGTPNGAYNPMPVIFNKKAFDNPANKNSNAPGAFDEPGSGNADVPSTSTSFNWTIFCTANGNPCNANSSGVDAIINNNGTGTTIQTDDVIGPLNAGSHTSLFSSLSSVVGNAYPVAIVDDSGAVQGWAWFHITGSVGGSTKQISGWFEEQVNPGPMVITAGHGAALGNFGAYSVKLTN